MKRVKPQPVRFGKGKPIISVREGIKICSKMQKE